LESLQELRGDLNAALLNEVGLSFATVAQAPLLPSLKLPILLLPVLPFGELLVQNNLFALLFHWQFLFG